MKSKQKYQLARLSAIATAVLMTSVFSTTNAATVKLNGTLFVNDQTQEFGEGGEKLKTMSAFLHQLVKALMTLE